MRQLGVAFTLIFCLSSGANDGDWKSKPDSYWKEHLSAEQIKFCRRQDDEAAFQGKYDKFNGVGEYHCSSCDLPLFRSSEKYESGTGYASFFDVISPKNIETKTQRHFGISRTEILCARCGAHLGYVFGDGPAPTFKRYRLNSACLNFIPPAKK